MGYPKKHRLNVFFYMWESVFSRSFVCKKGIEQPKNYLWSTSKRFTNYYQAIQDGKAIFRLMGVSQGPPRKTVYPEEVIVIQDFYYENYVCLDESSGHLKITYTNSNGYDWVCEVEKYLHLGLSQAFDFACFTYDLPTHTIRGNYEQ